MMQIYRLWPSNKNTYQASQTMKVTNNAMVSTPTTCSFHVMGPSSFFIFCHSSFVRGSPEDSNTFPPADFNPAPINHTIIPMPIRANRYSVPGAKMYHIVQSFLLVQIYEKKR